MMAQDFNPNDVSALSEATHGKTITGVTIQSGMDEHLIISFSDGSTLRIVYDYIYEWELTDANN